LLPRLTTEVIMADFEELDERTNVDGVPCRVLMGIDADGNKHILRCDKDGFLLVKTISIEEEEIGD
jgi:hypothetical protein